MSMLIARGFRSFRMALRGDSYVPWLTSPAARRFIRPSSRSMSVPRNTKWTAGPSGQLSFSLSARLLAALFSRRLDQLNVPLTGLETHRGMESRVLVLRSPQGHEQVAWVRQLLATRRTLYAGSYAVCTLPKSGTACIKVCFPLPNGRAIVIMRPEVHPDGSLSVISDGRAFGDPGFYFVVERDGAAWPGTSPR